MSPYFPTNLPVDLKILSSVMAPEHSHPLPSGVQAPGPKARDSMLALLPAPQMSIFFTPLNPSFSA